MTTNTTPKSRKATLVALSSFSPKIDRLTLLFSTMEARKAAIRREREDRKLSRRRYWWQDEQETTKTKR